MQDKKMNLFFAIFIIVFVLTFGFVFLSDNLRVFTRAGQSTLSLSKSLMIAGSLEAKTNSQAGVEITIFARNDAGISLPNKSVKVTADFGSFNNSEATTDNYGKAVFNLNSQFPGMATVKATIDSQTLPYELKIKFN
jgi:hypothetical protein